MRFFVPGVAIPQGSKRHVGGGRMVEGKNLAPWRTDVATLARHAHHGEPIATPVTLTLEFAFPRPKGHFGTGRNAGRLKESAPLWHCVAPDLDKLCRAVGDSLVIAGVLQDDSLIARLRAEKRYGVPAGVWVQVGLKSKETR